MCTNFRMKPASDGTVCVGRSMEFPNVIPWKIGIVPSGKNRTSHIAGSPKTWTPSYACVGICAFDDAQYLDDGMNTEGLSAHGLYMPGGFCTYAPPRGDGTDIAIMDVISFLLGTCATVEEAQQAMTTVNVVGVDPGMGFPPPLHILLYDTKDAAVIEFHPDGVRFVDNPVAMGTNAPYLDWHLTNLRNYIGLSSTNPTATFDDVTWTPLGQGQGVRGIPGDYSPPARFVRAFANVNLADQAEDSDDAERLTLHVLNTLDIVPGVIQEITEQGNHTVEVTDWVTIANLSQRRYSYRTYADPCPYTIDLQTADLSQERTLPLPGPQPFTPVAL